jgi:hypothetical protein
MVIAVANRARLHGTDVRPRMRLGDGDGADDPSLGNHGKPLVLLLLGTEVQQGQHEGNRVLVDQLGSRGRGACHQLLGHAGGGEVQAGATVLFGNARLHQAKFAKDFDQMDRKRLRFIHFLGNGGNFVIDHALEAV